MPNEQNNTSVYYQISCPAEINPQPLTRSAGGQRQILAISRQSELLAGHLQYAHCLTEQTKKNVFGYTVQCTVYIPFKRVLLKGKHFKIMFLNFSCGQEKKIPNPSAAFILYCIFQCCGSGSELCKILRPQHVHWY